MNLEAPYNLTDERKTQIARELFPPKLTQEYPIVIADDNNPFTSEELEEARKR